MAGEHSYSTQAVQALCDAYYTQPGTRVEDIRGAAARGELKRACPNGNNLNYQGPCGACNGECDQPAAGELQAEIAQISRAQCFELLRQDPRHHGNTRPILEAIWHDICDGQARVDAMPRRSLKQAIDRDKRQRSLLHTVRLYNEAKSRVPTQPAATDQAASSLLTTLTHAQAALRT